MHLVSYRNLSKAMLFNLPPLTNMSDTECSVQERVETMYTVEVSALIGGDEGLQGGVDRDIYMWEGRDN